MGTIIELMSMRGAWCMQPMIVEWLAYSSKVANVLYEIGTFLLKTWTMLMCLRR
jgi:hypothetical protein